MIKRLFLYIVSVLALVSGAAAQGTGSWTIMPVYGGAADRMIETPSLVYYLSKGHLFSYNKDTQETMHYSTVNKLNDIKINLIAYNAEKKYLAIAYDTHNVDLLYDNGRVVNMPDIRDADISSDKSIKSIDFGSGGRMFLATGFGFVVYDDDKHRVADSGVYNKAFEYAVQLADRLVLVDATGAVYDSPAADRHNSMASLRRTGSVSGTTRAYCRLGDSRIVYRSGAPTAAACVYNVLTPDFEAGTLASAKVDNGALRMDFARTADGRVRFASGTVQRVIGTDGTFKVERVVPSALFGKTITTGGDGDFWVSDNEGVSHINVGLDESITVLGNPSKPETLVCYWPAIKYISPDGRRIYMSNIGYDSFKNEVETPCFSVKQTTNIIEDGEIRDVSCYDIDNTGSIMTGGNTCIAEAPTDGSEYYIVNYQKGIYRIKDGIQTGKLGKGQLPYTESWAQWVYDISFDRDGNLWIGVWSTSVRNPVYILPADKLKDMDSVTPSDWLKPAVTPFSMGNGSVSVHHSGSGYVLYGCNHQQNGMLVYNHNGTPLDLSDDSYIKVDQYVTQDGDGVAIDRVFRMFEDRQGRIWVCHQNGVFVINDITKAVQGNSLHARRPKVSRNDGTNYADFLLAGEYVYDISEDPSGRKWIATRASGVYLVNDDGTEIIENYTIENSSLPSNQVFTVQADPFSNKVYFGTDKGVVCYMSDAAPGAEDYSDVYAYPNPVRPDYTGWITVTGLMDNSLVKIVDTAGHVVRQGTSEGGIFLWDGCNNANQRVRSGVYYVFASQNASGSASGRPATKILVIN